MQLTEEEAAAAQVPEFLALKKKKEPNVPDTPFKILSGPLRDTFIHSTTNS